MLIVYDSANGRECWIPSWYNDLCDKYDVRELCRIPFWLDTIHTKDRYQDIRRYLVWRVHNMERMRGVKKTVSIKNSSFFYAQKMKLYGRKVLDVDENGNYILGKWEKINPDSASTCHGSNTKTFELDGDYFAFAFTVDAMWGTDFPFSKVFLDNNVNSKYLDYVDWSDMNIRFTGGCRNVGISIKLNGVQIVDEHGCDDHSEWKP